MDNQVITGPWRATRLWNDIVRTVHDDIPLKKHWRGMKSHENCFTGSEAVNFLHKHLKKNPNFGTDVTKEQTTMLLDKLLRARVIEPIEVSITDDLDLSFSVNELYRLVDEATENLRSPGKKSPIKVARKVFNNIGNTPIKSGDQDSDKWETRSEFSGLKPKKDGTDQRKEDLNRSYFQSLPPNSLIILDNDSTWKEAFDGQLRANLSDAHVNSLDLDVHYIIYNMTKVSSKGIVQMPPRDSRDMPPWVLSAMKCLANWPKPMRMLNGEESTLPNYPAFISDVFNVVKGYFQGLSSPLVPSSLFDIFISAHIKAEAIGARSKIDTNKHNKIQTSTPAGESRNRFYVMGNSVGEDATERTAKIRQTFECMPNQNSFDASTSIGSFGFIEDRPPLALTADMSTTAIMKSFLPPNSCFETAFMNEQPITRIVPQRDSDVSHLSRRYRSSSRASMISGWDTRSIATQTSQDEEAVAKPRRQPRWKRASSASGKRKSIAVMEPSDDGGFVNRGFQNSPRSEVVNRPSNFSSVDNLLDGAVSNASSTLEQQNFLLKYKKISNLTNPPMDSAGSHNSTRCLDDNVIWSKTVRKEKKKQERIRRERSHSVDRINQRRSFVQRGGYVNLALDQPTNSYYHTSHFNNLTVKTPIDPHWERVRSADLWDNQGDMQYVRAVPYRQGSELSLEGIKSAVDSYKLLGLLLPPSNRRRLQLLLKFMKRVSSNQHLKLCKEGHRSNLTLVLDTFTESVLKPQGLSRYDEELCRTIVKFFVLNYDAIWVPPESLRREVEEKVYQSLVSKRIKAGEDPYPITFCNRLSAKEYDQEKSTTVHSAMKDLLEQMLSSAKLSDSEKRKKLKKFREAYPDIYKDKFPTEDDEPEFMKKKQLNLSAAMNSKMSSLSKLKSVMRI